MVRTNLPYCFCTSKKLASGKYKDYWRFRKGDRNTTLPGQPGDPEFHERYSQLMQEVKDAEAAQQIRSADRNTFAFLCRAYLTSAEFGALALKTQKDYQFTIEKRLVPVLGPERYDCIDRATVKAVRDSLAAQHRAQDQADGGQALQLGRGRRPAAA